MEELRAQAMRTGEEVVHRQLAERAVQLTQTIAHAFTHASLNHVQADFEDAFQKQPNHTNDKVAELANLVREEAAVAAEHFRAAEMWIHLNVPVASDGNNFGVDVQMHVATELAKKREAILAMVKSADSYHWARAEALMKLWPSSAKECEEDQTAESTTKREAGKDEEKTTVNKVVTRQKTSSKEASAPADYKKYVVSLDVKWYHTLYTQLVEVRDAYVKAEDVVRKNAVRLADPRGEAGQGSRGVMTMY